MGAAEAVEEIRRLEKEDPYGAELLRETNPWNSIGRRRFLAQLAGSEIKDRVGALSADSSLLQYPPGHPALAKAKMDATSQVLDKYGLQPEYLESQYYVAPEMNEAWDDFTKAHSKAYAEEMTRTNLEAGKASLLAKGKYLMGGVQLGNGVTVRKGEDGWLEAAMAQLQPQLDAVIALFPGNRKEAVKELREYLSKTLGVYAPELVANLRGGDANLPLEDRPAWGDSYQYELIEGALQVSKTSTRWTRRRKRICRQRQKRTICRTSQRNCLAARSMQRPMRRGWVAIRSSGASLIWAPS